MRLFLGMIMILVCVTLVGVVGAQTGQPRPGGAAPGGTAPDAAASAGTLPAADAATYQQQIGYALGRNIGNDLRRNEVQCDFESLVAGIRDALSDTKSKWSDQELAGVMQRFQREMQQKAVVREQRLAMKNQEQAAAFLESNKKQPGVQATTSGLQFKVVKQGNGPSPTAKDSVRCNYRGVLLDGTEFDSSDKHGGPAEFEVGRVIPGWTEALQKMHVGDKWQLFVPGDLAYGMDPPGPPIEPQSMLIFDVELLEILPQ